MKDVNLEIIDKLRADGILVDINTSLLPRNSQDIIIAACVDNLHGEEKRLHLGKLVRSQKPFLYSGGGCLAGTPRKMVGQQSAQMLQALLKAAKQHKPSAIVLSGHYPCRWATARGMGIYEQVLFLREAYHRMSDLLKVHPHNLTEIDVYIFFHVWYGERKRTYKINLL
jgi:hypothetical protein